MPTWRNFFKGTNLQFPGTSRVYLILVNSLQIQLLHFLQQFKAKVLARSKDKLPTTPGYDYSAKALLAHLNHPLGNPNGPNSQTIDWLMYARIHNVFVSVLQRFYSIT